MFERFTDKSRTIMERAQDEARRLGRNFVGTEQILLGMLVEGNNKAAVAMADVTITLEDARNEVEQIIGRGSGFMQPQIPVTPRAKRVMELAFEEAKQKGDESIEPKHLLLGIMLEGDGVAAAVIRKLAHPSNDIIQRFYESFSDSN